MIEDVEIVVNDLQTKLINKQHNIIKRLQLGFVENDCSIPIFAILIHSVENINILNEQQRDNINEFINKLNYV